MGAPTLSNIYDPEVITKVIGDGWVTDAKIVQSGVAAVESLPNQGSQIFLVRDRKFQDSSGQAIASGGTIAATVATQTKVTHPKLWRYGSMEEPDVLEDVRLKGVAEENADVASSIRAAAIQYVDDSAIACIKGTGAALTGNQYDGHGATIDALDDLVNSIEVLGEKGFALQGGGIALRSAPYFKLVKLGLVAATSNTFGNALQDQIARQGMLPSNILGMTPIVTDKLESLGSNLYYMYFLGRGAMAIHGATTPVVEVARKAALREFTTVTNFKMAFGVGFYGVTWGGAASETVSDTDLATSANWTLSYSSATQVAIVRHYVKIA